jgi:antitoxin ParD1/3/4
MTISITLPEDLSELVEAKVATGGYKTSDHVIRAALKLLHQHDSERDEKLAWLRAAWKEGIESGNAGPLDFEELKREATVELLAARAAE